MTIKRLLDAKPRSHDVGDRVNDMTAGTHGINRASTVDNRVNNMPAGSHRTKEGIVVNSKRRAGNRYHSYKEAVRIGKPQPRRY